MLIKLIRGKRMDFKEAFVSTPLKGAVIILLVLIRDKDMAVLLEDLGTPLYDCKPHTKVRGRVNNQPC